MPNEPPEHRIGHSGHGRQHRSRPHHHRAQAYLRRNPRLRGHRVLHRIVPVLLHGKSASSHRDLVPEPTITSTRRVPHPCARLFCAARVGNLGPTRQLGRHRKSRKLPRINWASAAAEAQLETPSQPVTWPPLPLLSPCRSWHTSAGTAPRVPPYPPASACR